MFERTRAGAPSGRAGRRSLRELVALALLFWISLPVEAHAYIDPGSGALFLQAILAGIAGSLFMARERLGRVVRWVFGRHRRDVAWSAPPAQPAAARADAACAAPLQAEAPSGPSGASEARPAPPAAPHD